MRRVAKAASEMKLMLNGITYTPERSSPFLVFRLNFEMHATNKGETKTSTCDLCNIYLKEFPVTPYTV